MDDAQCATRREVAESRGNVPLRQLTLMPGFADKYIEAGVRPKHNISDPGPETVAISAKPIHAGDTKGIINPDFRNFVETPNTNYVSGMWAVLGTWTSSVGDDLVNGYGLRVASIVAAFVPKRRADRRYDVESRDDARENCGAGIRHRGLAGRQCRAAHQKADIFIKYDPRTRNGYSLRFWRTIQAADKCMFQLYQIVDGVGHPVSDQQQLTGVFKPNTTIVFSVNWDTFTATGSNTVDGETLSLKAIITRNNYGGAGVAWTGSVPFGNSVVVSQFEITYPREKKQLAIVGPI